MYKNIKIKFLLLFFIISAVIFFIVSNEKNEKIDNFLNTKSDQIALQYDAIYKKYKTISEIIYITSIVTKDTTDIFKDAKDANSAQKAVIREKLHNHLAKEYELLKKYNIRQLHFHLPDCESFLRFHKISKFGDNLFDVRDTVNYVNENKKPIDGFEEGRIYSGYRFVYPLISKNEHLGSVEVSFSIDAMSKKFFETYHHTVLFHIRKDIVDKKVFKSEQSNYIQSPFENYLIEKKSISNNNLNIHKNFSHTLKSFISSNKILENTTSIYDDELNKVITLIPVKNPISNKMVGFFTVASDAKYINNKTLNYLLSLLTLVLLAGFIVYYIYSIFVSKEKAKNHQIELENIIKDKTRELQKYLDIVNQYVIISTTDIQGTITYANEAFCKISGYTKEELEGNSHNIIKDPEMPENTFKKMWKRISSGKRWYGRVKNLKKDGTKYWVDTLIEPNFDKNGVIDSYTAVRVDITDKIELEELTKNQEIVIESQINIANLQRDKAIKANNAKSEFLANMSHEIRTPLNAILGFVGFLKEKSIDKESKKYLEIIDDSSHHLLGIINDILDFSKIESDNLVLDKIDFKPIDELSSTISLFEGKCKEKNINFIVDIANNIPEFINTDPLRVKQIISNLLSNAIKFTHEDKSVYIKLYFENNFLNVSIKDEGIGISQNKLDIIFEAFSQADSSTTRKYGGTGLGLTICKNLVKHLGGELNVKSEIDVGSEFYFSIPVKIAKGSVTKKSTSAKKLSGHILLVEDNKANQMFMKVILKKLGFTFDIANDGVEAIEAFKNNKYNAILMDENMPNMNGIEATKHILKYESDYNLDHIPIIALTANALKGDREKFLDAGMDEYLTKPLDKGKFSKIIEKFVCQADHNIE